MTDTVTTNETYAEMTGQIIIRSSTSGPDGIGHYVRLGDLRTVCGRFDVTTCQIAPKVNTSTPPPLCKVCAGVASQTWHKRTS